MAGTVDLVYRQITDSLIEVKATGTCEAAAATWPATVLSHRPENDNIDLTGWYLWLVTAWPGGTAPTDASDLTITDLDGIDILGGRGTNLLDATSLTSTCAGTTTTDMPMLITGPVTLNLSGNSVNAAIVYLKLLFVKKA